MPQTVTAVRQGPGKRFSRAAAAAMSTAGATSIDVLTVSHGLGRSPTHVLIVPRTVNVVPSGGVPVAVVDSWNASQVTIRLPAQDGGASAVQIDVVCVAEHSFVA